MAENVHFKYPNFCFGPQAGTFCSVNQDASAILRIKNSTGTFLADYSFTSDITNDLIHIEYVGPSNLSSVIDGLSFFTVEKVSSSSCMIKRWETDYSSLELSLKQTITKTTDGSYYYDLNSAAVEYYETTFSTHTASGTNYIDLTNAKRIVSGMKLYLGPSSDADNENANEHVTVDHRSGSRIYLTSTVNYDYVLGDQVSYYKNIYLISNIGVAGDSSRGTIFKVNAHTGSIDDINTDKVYQNVDSSRWCPLSETVASISSNNVFFINPYAYYSNWRSMCLNNLENDYATVIPYYDTLFDDYSVYFLANKKLIRGDEYDTDAVEDWGTWYNYTENTLLPYSNTILIYCDDTNLIGDSVSTTIHTKVVDQYGVGLQGKTVNFYIVSGDIAAEFTPTNGQVETDINGKASILYTSGYTYAGPTLITCRTDGASTTTGSQYIWNSIRIHKTLSADNYGKIHSIDTDISGAGRLRDRATEEDINFSMFCKTFFTNPGGDWYNSYYAGQVPIYLPDLIVGAGDGPDQSFSGEPPFSPPDGLAPMPTVIHQMEDFESENTVRQLKDFKCLTEYVDGKFKYEHPYFLVKQIIESFTLQLSQLKVSGHTYWVDTDPYDYLWTYITLDQFIFVDDAIPAFWSIKNPVDTDIWIRLRPFAYSLNASRLSFYVREVSYAGDTGYVDVTSQVTHQYFDAGGGALGVELTYDPTENFHYDAVVYVFIQIYDLAPTPNRITTNYYFSVIPDYKSPYLDNLNPSRDQAEVAVNSNIYFEIKDGGTGVDINTLEMYVNSRVVTPTNIIKVNDNYYKVTYTPPQNFPYGKRIAVGVIVDDLSGNANWLNSRYSFYTVDSEGVYFTNFEPNMCKRGLSKFSDVSFVALGLGSGVDSKTLRLQVRDKDVSDKTNVVPVLYRLSLDDYTTQTSLNISNFVPGPEVYISLVDFVSVDITDNNYLVSVSGTTCSGNCCLKIDGESVPVTFSGITDGYRMFYDSPNDFASIAGSTEFLVHAENSNGDVLEKSFYLTTGYFVEYDNEEQFDYNTKVLVRVSAEDLANCPSDSADAYWFETEGLKNRDLCVSITGVLPDVVSSEKGLKATVYPKSLAYFYGKTFRVTLRCKDFSGNVMEPYEFEFKVEDGPE
jgi:hypothetical protein